MLQQVYGAAACGVCTPRPDGPVGPVRVCVISLALGIEDAQFGIEGIRFSILIVADLPAIDVLWAPGAHLRARQPGISDCFTLPASTQPHAPLNRRPAALLGWHGASNAAPRPRRSRVLDA